MGTVVVRLKSHSIFILVGIFTCVDIRICLYEEIRILTYFYTNECLYTLFFTQNKKKETKVSVSYIVSYGDCGLHTSKRGVLFIR